MKAAKHVHIVSPSGAVSPAFVDGAAEVLRGRGYLVTIGRHTRGSYGRFAGMEEERLEDLNEGLADESVDVLLCSRGGYGLAEIIDRVQVPEGKCPLVTGFSDITALHNLMGRHGKMSVHGVMCKHIAENGGEGESAKALIECIETLHVAYDIPKHQCNISGEVKGMLRGGNLSVMYGLQGTPYAVPVKQGDILFIEDVGEHPYAVDRMMQNLRLSGLLGKIGGLVVGQFSDYDEDPAMPFTVYEGIRRMIVDYGVPVMFDFPAGHVPRNLPLLMNAPCMLTVGDKGAKLVQEYNDSE